MNLQALKDKLPDGSYDKIAEQTGKSYGTVSQFFNGYEVRVGEDTKQAFIQLAIKIVEEEGSNMIDTANKAKEMLQKAA